MEKQMKRIIDTLETAKREQNVNVFNWKETLKDRTVVAFGLGKFFQDVYERLFQACRVDYLCDNNEKLWGRLYHGRTCLPPENLTELSNVFVIIVMGNPNPVRDQLDQMGIESMHISEMHFEYYLKGTDLSWMEEALPSIEDVMKRLKDEQSRQLYTEIICRKLGACYATVPYSSMYSGGEYFQQGIWRLTDRETFLDVGAYRGDTVKEFLEETGNQFQKAYAMELSPKNARYLQSYVDSLEGDVAERIQVICAGAWDSEQKAWCDAYGDMDGCAVMDDERGEACRLTRIDQIIPQGEKITTLKMDIEGAELRALEGARRVIAESRPKLAICLYHRPEDFWEIPLKLQEICPDYQLYIRHHSMCNYTDSVLYAFV